MLNLNQDGFQKEVLDHKGVVVVDFYADWCGPCRMLSPMIEEMDKTNKDKNVKFVKVNVDANQGLAGLFGVMSIPTVIIFKDGKIFTQQIGVAPKNFYEEAIKKAVTAKSS